MHNNWEISTLQFDLARNALESQGYGSLMIGEYIYTNLSDSVEVKEKCVWRLHKLFALRRLRLKRSYTPQLPEGNNYFPLEIECGHVFGFEFFRVCLF